MASSISDAWSLLSNGDVAKSKLVLETLVHASPSDIQARLLLAQACLELRDPASFSEALTNARQAFALKRRPACALTVAVSIGAIARVPQLPDHTRQAHRDEAIQELQSCLAELPGDLTALVQYNLAVLLAEAGQLDASMQHAGAALEACSGPAAVAVSVLDLHGGSEVQLAGRQQLTTLCLILLGMLMSARQEHSTALRLLTAAPTPEPLAANGGTSPTSPLHAGEVLLARLRARLLADETSGGGGDPQAAMAVLAQLKRRIAAMSGTSGKALTERSSEMRAEVWQELALLCADSEDHTNALFCVEQAMQLCPWQARSYQVLGRVHEACGRAASAMEGYNTALALDPCHAPSLISLGTLYRRHGTPADLALARDLLSDALRYDAMSSTAWHQLGLACQGLGHREEAEKNLRTAVSLAACSPALPFSDCPLLLRL